jgi:7-cyano-7-deazaguanine synthase in queuosine biosynthesis
MADSKFTVNLVDVNLYEGKKAVMLSGGTDSALLAFMLLKNTDEEIHFITFVTEKRKALEKSITDGILDFIKTKLPEAKFTHEYIDLGHMNNDDAWPILKSKMEAGEFDTLYRGTSAIPQDFLNRPDKPTDNRPPLVERTEEMIHEGYRLYSPFINIHKRKIAELYEAVGALELIPLTRSCSAKFGLDEDPCMVCYHCKVREWAFGLS